MATIKYNRDDNPTRVDVTLTDGSVIAVWWLGNEYQPTDRGYRQRYGYTIIGEPDPAGRRQPWEYVGDDIRSGVGADTDTRYAADTLISFLAAAAEAYSSVVMSGRDSDNYDLFPVHVSEWSYMHADELSLLALELGRFSFGELLEFGRFASGVACSDCLMGLTNGDWPTEFNENWTMARDDSVGATLNRYDVTLGHMHSGPYAEVGCFHHGADCAEDCDCERTEFSWTPCSACGTTLAGYRHDLIMVNRDDLI